MPNHNSAISTNSSTDTGPSRIFGALVFEGANSMDVTSSIRPGLFQKSPESILSPTMTSPSVNMPTLQPSASDQARESCEENSDSEPEPKVMNAIGPLLEQRP
eukprot:UN06562